MQSIAIRLARRDGNRCDATEPGEGAVTVDPLDVLARRHEQLRSVLDADSLALEQTRSTSRDKFGQVHVDTLDLLVEGLHPSAQLAQCELGRLRRFTETIEVGSKRHRSIDAVTRSTGRLDVLTQLDRSGDQDVTDLQQRHRASLDGRLTRHLQELNRTLGRGQRR